MKRSIQFILMVILAVCSMTAQEIARVELKEFKSDLFPFERPILIYTPQAYDECTESDYDVIYVFDAQSRSSFDEVHSLLHFGVQQPRTDRQYIVVGVASPSLWEIDYCRNNDFLPVPKNQMMQTPYCGSVDKFKKFLKEELMPYVDTNYRTTGHTLGIGHSLGASFVIDAMTNDDMFDDIIAISPNMAWDDDYYANMVKHFDFDNSRSRFIYMSMANEATETDEFGFPKQWRESWDNIKEYLSAQNIPEQVVLNIVDMPEYGHAQVVLPAHLDALKRYAGYRYNPVFIDNKLYPVHIELSGASVEGDVYITGNQPALADWNPKGTKMNVLNDTTRVIDLNLRLPAEFKFTKGTWESAFFIDNGDSGNIRIACPEKTVKHYKTF